ncbi:hypothetical protein [Luteimonas aquatica]|uniref:hypothetical protein n=1 Tax=Luteimonas aquatica TaxID=450364 RepID=UPI001F590462|nr:hypothetical protein [Luteimonas aquatica]
MNRRLPLIVIAVLAVAAAAYFLGRATAPKPIETQAGGLGGTIVPEPQAPAQAGPKPLSDLLKGAPLPAPNAPLKQTFADLQARANGGDRGAAMRLYRDLGRCSRLRGSEWRNAGARNELTETKTDGMTPAQLRTYQKLLDSAELRQQGVRQDQALCEGVSDEMLGNLVDSMAQAAKLGDEEARSCYLASGPLYDMRNMVQNPESLRNYRSNAAGMIKTGLASGDWRVVDLLQRAYEPGAQSLLAGLMGADPVQHYRYLKLYRLGAEPHRALQLDRQLAASAASLNQAQLAEADEWAQRTLRGNFEGNSTNTTPPGWEACTF